MIKITVEKAMELHGIMSKVTGGSAGVRDISLLESALYAAYQTFGGEELYKTVEEKAARLGFSLISNHPFVDGNKRIGMFVMIIFLLVNGVEINPTEAEVVKVGLSVAASEMSYSELLSWITDNKV